MTLETFPIKKGFKCASASKYAFSRHIGLPWAKDYLASPISKRCCINRFLWNSAAFIWLVDFHLWILWSTKLSLLRKLKIIRKKSKSIKKKHWQKWQPREWKQTATCGFFFCCCCLRRLWFLSFRKRLERREGISINEHRFSYCVHLDGKLSGSK